MLGRIGIGGKHGDQKEHERDSGNKAGGFPQQTETASNFAESGDCHENGGGRHPLVAQCWRDHGRHCACGGGHKVADAHADKCEREGDSQHPLGDFGGIHHGPMVALSCHMATAASRRR